MSELKAILESTVLSDEVKTSLQEAFDQHVQSAVQAKEVELTEQMVDQRRALAKQAIEMVEEAVSEEFKHIQDEIVEAKSVDVRYAVKLEEFKESYAEKMEKQVDEVLKATIAEEITELRESLEEARNNMIGSQIFESFKDVIQGTMREEGDQTEELKANLATALKENEEFKRTAKLNELLEGVTGKKRKVAMTMLEDIPMDRLEKRFQELAESYINIDESKEEKEEPVTESVKDEEKPKGTVVLETESQDKKKDDQWLKNARRLAGLD